MLRRENQIDRLLGFDNQANTYSFMQAPVLRKHKYNVLVFANLTC